jgi:hypothetical protein
LSPPPPDAAAAVAGSPPVPVALAVAGTPPPPDALAAAAPLVTVTLAPGASTAPGIQELIANFTREISTLQPSVQLLVEGAMRYVGAAPASDTYKSKTPAAAYAPKQPQAATPAAYTPGATPGYSMSSHSTSSSKSRSWVRSTGSDRLKWQYGNRGQRWNALGCTHVHIPAVGNMHVAVRS